MRLRQRLLRGQQHHHLPAFESRELLDGRDRIEVAPDPLQQAHPELLVRHLATAEAQRDLGLVAFGQKPRQVAQLDLVIAFVGSRPELHFLDLDLLELELRLVLLLRLPVLELAVIHDPAHRGFRHRGDLDEVEFRGFRLRHRFVERDDAELLAFDADQSYFRGVDFAVQSLLLLVQSYARSPKKDKKRPASRDPGRRAGVIRGRLPPPGGAPARRRRAWRRDPCRRGYARPPFQPPAPYRRRSADRAAFGGYVREFYSLFSRCANRSPPAGRPRGACSRLLRRTRAGGR